MFGKYIILKLDLERVRHDSVYILEMNSDFADEIGEEKGVAGAEAEIWTGYIPIQIQSRWLLAELIGVLDKRSLNWGRNIILKTSGTVRFDP